jgi:DNA-binding response OmpR family regulator
MPKILIVEDDAALNNGIALSLRQDNFEFTQCSTVHAARQRLAAEKYDLIILDVNLPDGNGFELCREIRKSSSAPIIFLTVNDLELDVVTGLELGADDYITKPFSLMILRARVSALLRRSSAQPSGKVCIDDFSFDFDAMEFYKQKVQIELSKTEQKLLKLLVSHRGSVLARSVLVDRIWTDGAEYVDENALSVTVKRLRDKLEDNPSKPIHIQTVYGIGYTWPVDKTPDKAGE